MRIISPRSRHLEVQRNSDFALEPGHVFVTYMAAILAQMGGDAVRAGLDGEQRRANRIRARSAACIADGGDVIDVDAQPQTRR